MDRRWRDVEALTEVSLSRTAVLDEVAGRIGRLRLGHPVRVAIDGRTASGKTTLGDELAASLVGQGRPVSRTSIDAFTMRFDALVTSAHRFLMDRA